MSRSSGRFVTDRVEWHECVGQIARMRFLRGMPDEFTYSRPCRYSGDVEVFIDPEAMHAHWTCPGCGTDHEVSWDDITAPDPDRESGDSLTTGENR